MLTLYYAPNTCALASHIALREAGAEFRAVRVDFATGQQKSDDYRQVNPKARVPSLVTDRGILTETPAILVYIAQCFPAAKLIPADPFGLAKVQEFNSYLCSTVHVAHAHRMRGHRWTDDPAAMEAFKKFVPRSVGDAFDLIERHMLAGPWVMGDTFTICDPYLFTLAQWLKADGVDIDTLPKVKAHSARVAERAATKAALAVELEPA